MCVISDVIGIPKLKRKENKLLDMDDWKLS